MAKNSENMVNKSNKIIIKGAREHPATFHFVQGAGRDEK